MPEISDIFEFSEYFRIHKIINYVFDGMFDDIHQVRSYISNNEAIEIKRVNKDFAITLSDSEAKVVWCNERYTKLTGYAQQAVLGSRVRETMYGKKSVRVDKDYVDNNVKKGAPFYFENIAYKNNGTEYWFGVAIFPIYNTKKELYGRSHCILDISEKKFRAITAAKNEAVINLAIENTDIMFWSFDATVQQLTLSDKQMEVLTPEFISNLRQKITDIIAASVFTTEARKDLIHNVSIDSDDGHQDKKVYDIMIKCIEWGSNFQPVQYVGALQDVTIRNNHYIEVIEKNKQLEKLNSNLDGFVYSASHNLRSPLTSIKGIVDILLNHDLSPEKSRFFISEINKSIDKLDSTIFDIIEYSKNTHDSINVSIVDIESLIRNSFAQNMHYNKTDIELRVNAEISSPFTSDYKRVGSLVDNVISNAIKYNDAKKTHSYINAHIHIDELECIILIEDNGIGMSEETLKKAFKMFYRGTNNVAGSGLGLFIVQEIIDKIGGKIEMESTIDVGTKITIHLKNIK